MAELVDAHDSKSCGETHESSILSRGTNNKNPLVWVLVILVVGRIERRSDVTLALLASVTVRRWPDQIFGRKFESRPILSRGTELKSPNLYWLGDFLF